MRRTKASLIYQKAKNLRVDQLLLGHRKLESTVRYLDLEVEDALEVSEKRECAFDPECSPGGNCSGNRF